MTSLCGLYYMVVTYDWGFLVWVVLGLLFSWLCYVFYDVVYPPRFVATFSTRQTLATKTRRNQAKQYKTSTRYGFPFVHYAHSHCPQPYKIVPLIDWEWSQRRRMLRTQWSCTWNMCHVNPMIRTCEAPCVILLKLLNNKFANWFENVVWTRAKKLLYFFLLACGLISLFEIGCWNWES
jgi:hypothetical protein